MTHAIPASSPRHLEESNGKLSEGRPLTSDHNIVGVGLRVCLLQIRHDNLQKQADAFGERLKKFSDELEAHIKTFPKEETQC